MQPIKEYKYILHPLFEPYKETVLTNIKIALSNPGRKISPYALQYLDATVPSWFIYNSHSSKWDSIAAQQLFGVGGNHITTNYNSPAIIDKYWYSVKNIPTFSWRWFIPHVTTFAIIKKHWNWIVKNSQINWTTLLLNPNANKFIQELLANDPKHLHSTSIHNVIHTRMLDDLPPYTGNKLFVIDYMDDNWNTLCKQNKISIHDVCSDYNYGMHFIDRHWDWFVKQPYIDQYYTDLFNNPNVHTLIEKHWDWFAYNPKIPEYVWAKLYSNPNAGQLVLKHWDWFVYKIPNYITTNVHPLVMTVHLDWFIEEGGFSWMTLQRNASAQDVITFIDTHWQWLIENDKIEWRRIYETHHDSTTIINYYWDWLIANDKMPNNIGMKLSTDYNLIDAHWDWFITKYNTTDNYNFKIHIGDIKWWPIAMLEKRWDWIIIEQQQEAMWPSHKLRASYHIYSTDEGAKFLLKHFDWFIINNDINWEQLIAYSPAPFIDTYQPAAKQYFMSTIAAELMARIWHPSNIHRFPDLGFDPDE